MNDLKLNPHPNMQILAPIIDLPGYSAEIFTTEFKKEDYSLTVETLHGVYEPQYTEKQGPINIKATGLELTTHHCTLHPLTKENSAQLNLKDIFTLVTNIPLENSKFTIENNTLCKYNVLDNGHKICDRVVLSNGDVKSDISVTKDLSNFNSLINTDYNLTAVFPEKYTAINSYYSSMPSEYPAKTLNNLAPNSLSDIILSRTYSSNPAKTEDLLHNALNTYGQFSYTDDIIKALLSNVATDNASPPIQVDSLFPFDNVIYSVSLQPKPLKIAHYQETEISNQMLAPGFEEQEIPGGEYLPASNVISIFSRTSDIGTDFSSCFIHETGHYVMNLLFKNNTLPYNKSNFEQYNNYEQAELVVFKNLGTKLGLTPSELQPLNKVNEVIEVIKHHPVMELGIYFSNANESKDKQYISEMRNKYGFSYFNDYLPETLIDAKLQLKFLSSMPSLNSDHLKIIGEFIALIHMYPRDELSMELIIRIPQLLANGVAPTTLESYFKPIMNYWDNHISPEIATLYENHQEQCQGANTYVPECLPNYLDIYQQAAMMV